MAVWLQPRGGNPCADKFIAVSATSQPGQAAGCISSRPSRMFPRRSAAPVAKQRPRSSPRRRGYWGFGRETQFPVTSWRTTRVMPPKINITTGLIRWNRVSVRATAAAIATPAPL